MFYLKLAHHCYSHNAVGINRPPWKPRNRGVGIHGKQLGDKTDKLQHNLDLATWVPQTSSLPTTTTPEVQQPQTSKRKATGMLQARL